MLKKLLLIALGAAGALQLDRFWQARRERFTPNAITGSLLDRLNSRLEAGRTGSEPGGGGGSEPGVRHR